MKKLGVNEINKMDNLETNLQDDNDMFEIVDIEEKLDFAVSNNHKCSVF